MSLCKYVAVLCVRNAVSRSSEGTGLLETLFFLFLVTFYWSVEGDVELKACTHPSKRTAFMHGCVAGLNENSALVSLLRAQVNTHALLLLQGPPFRNSRRPASHWLSLLSSAGSDFHPSIKSLFHRSFIKICKTDIAIIRCLFMRKHSTSL